MKTLIAIASLFLTQTALATNAYNYHNLGFSPDGRYYAFAESVVSDGAGFPIAMAAVVDVAQNRWVKSERVLIQDEEVTERQALQQAISKLNPAAYGIDQKKKGRTLWQRLPTDLSDRSLSARFALDYGVDGGASTVGPKFEVNISESPAPTETECWGFDGKMITVSFTETYGATLIKSLELQRDTRVPKSRGCAWAYQVRQAIAYGDSLVAVIRYETPGFEGPDYRHMVVTGKDVLKF